MPLKQGPGSMKKNITELMTGEMSPSRKKAIKTIAKKEGISFEEARKKQAFAISKSQLRK